MLQNELFNTIIHDFNTGYWELPEEANQEVWSEKFYTTLGYHLGDIDPTVDYFLSHLIHKDDVEMFRDNFLNYQKNKINFKQHIKILNKQGDYQLFKCATNDELPVNIKSKTNFIFFFEIKLEPDKTIKNDIFYYRETAEMTTTGSWYVDFKKKESYWDFETRRILEYPDEYTPSLKDSANYYAKDCQKQAADLFFKCAMIGTPFDTEIKMVTAHGREFWAKAIGKPAYNTDREIIGVRGVFQDIDKTKRKELRLQKSIDIIASQNSRLFNFAHIVSHNLRSHTSNLSLLIQLMDTIENPNEKIELIDDFRAISSNLNATIEHLNEVVSIHSNKKQEQTTVKFTEAFAHVTKSIGHIIDTNNAVITTDFSAFDTIQYNPAYIESILLNLITNAIKYKHPDRNPIIAIKTIIKDDHNYLTITDNGIGIDLNIYKDKIFGMYTTFHENEDAVGIGLFLIKNQIESLNGSIDIDSTVGVGTTFSIKF